MKHPKSITITVVNSPNADKKHDISVHYQIIVRKILNMFARDPSTFAPVNYKLVEEVCKYGPASLGMEDDRLLTTELVEAMMTDNKVC